MAKRTQKIYWQEMTLGSKILAVISDLLFTLAFFVLIFVLWKLYWTAVPAYYEQRELAATVQWDEPEDPNAPAVPLDYLPCDASNGLKWQEIWGENWQADYKANWVEPSEIKTMIGRMYIPDFGGDYSRNVVQGTDRFTVLDKQGFGHYQGLAMPGCVGNYAVAAHRDGYGAPLGDIEVIHQGDAIIVRTKEFWYVYKATTHEVVDPKQGSGVLLPVPNQPNATPTKRFITMTTCHPRWSMNQRYIQYGELSYWAKVKSGVPQELLDVGAKVKVN